MEDKICISINNKKFNKENEKTKEAIYKALNKLCELILQFEENGQPFERIFTITSTRINLDMLTILNLGFYIIL